MQQQREKNQSETKDIQDINAQEIFEYNTKRFHFFRWLPLSMILIMSTWSIWSIYDAISNKKSPVLFSMISPLILAYMFSWRKEQEYAKWLRLHKDEKLMVDAKGINWYGKATSVSMRWEEITQAYREKDDIYVLVKGGTKEEEIRFWNCVYLSSSHKKNRFWDTSITPILLASRIAEYCPLLKSHPWEHKDSETLAPKSFASAYQTAGAQIFSYHTYVNRSYVTDRMSRLAALSLLLGALLYGLGDTLNLPLTLKITLTILPSLVCVIFGYRWWQWFRQSQIETDDLGIALVEPKGIKWHIQWFTVESYMSDNKHGILKTKDGKTYKFPLNTARKDDLEAEIRRRVSGKG
jgi:hypothetical protein